MDLDDILADETPKPAEPVERAQSHRKAHLEREYAAQGRGPDGRFLPKEETPEPAATPVAPAETPAVAASPAPATPIAEPAEQPLTPRERAFLARAQDEARKRQELERRYQQQPQQPPGETPDPNAKFWEDPNAALTKHRQEIESITVQTRLNTTEALARQRYPDFDLNIQEFAQVLQSTPGLQGQWLSQVDPAEFAYQTGKRHKELREAGGIEQLRTKIEAETRARVKAELDAEYKKREDDAMKAREALPGSLAGVTGTRQQTPAWSGPTPMEDILKP